MRLSPEIRAAVDQINVETCSVAQAAAESGLSHMTVRKRIRQQRIRAVCVGGILRVWKADCKGLR
jgi:hypothetical protein